MDIWLLSKRQNLKDASAKTFTISLAGVEIKTLEANIKNIDPRKAKTVLRKVMQRYALPTIFIWILAYHNFVFVNSWIQTAIEKDLQGAPTHGSCCVAWSATGSFNPSGLDIAGQTLFMRKQSEKKSVRDSFAMWRWDQREMHVARLLQNMLPDGWVTIWIYGSAPFVTVALVSERRTSWSLRGAAAYENQFVPIPQPCLCCEPWKASSCAAGFCIIINKGI